MKVFLSPIAYQKLHELSEYLLDKWGKKIQEDLIQKLKQKLEQISSQPESCTRSQQFKGLYKCVLTKHNSIYYRIKHDSEEIEIITIFDSRMNPKRLAEELGSV